MAEERTLGLARAQEVMGEEPSKEELQRRLDEARDSISHTVTEIRDSVANQVQAVKESLDWREQFKKRPVAWSAGAVGVGFLVGYGLTAMIRGESDDWPSYDRYEEGQRSYSAQPIIGTHAAAASMGAPSAAPEFDQAGNTDREDDGPGFFGKIAATPAYHKVKQEAGSIGDAFVQEVVNTAKTMVIPAVITSLRHFIGGYLPNADAGEQSQAGGYSAARSEADRGRAGSSSHYQPALERNQT